MSPEFTICKSWEEIHNMSTVALGRALCVGHKSQQIRRHSLFLSCLHSSISNSAHDGGNVNRCCIIGCANRAARAKNVKRLAEVSSWTGGIYHSPLVEKSRIARRRRRERGATIPVQSWRVTNLRQSPDDVTLRNTFLCSVDGSSTECCDFSHKNVLCITFGSLSIFNFGGL